MASETAVVDSEHEAPRTGWGEDRGGREPELLIEDHALIGDLQTAALVARDGSIDWLCLPSFDSDAAFCALLGRPEHGRWKIAPRVPVRQVRRRYRGDTLVLETDFVTDHGRVRLIDFMPPRSGAPHLVRIVECQRGEVPMRSDFAPRFGFGLTRPMVRSEADATAVTAGTDALYLRFGLATNLPPPLREEFILKEGQRIRYVATWAPSYANTPDAVDPEEALRRTQKFWGDWCSRITLPEFFANDVMRSLITLKACTFEPSGSIVAAPTTSLPEGLGGGRNWDYRFCWLRDGWLTLGAFLRAGLFFEARALTRWLERSAGGSPDQLQIMYGIRGERRLTEAQLDWLPGYADSLPVRVGNGAYTQFQLDVFGEILSTAYIAIKHQGFITPERWSFYRGVAEYVAEHWKDQDQGLWEMRGPKRSFTASKVSAWTAIDRTVRLIQEFHLPQDPAPWVTLRDAIALDINSQGYDNKRKTFTQAYGSKGLDASLLLIALSGFLAPSDPRLVGTVKAIEHELLEDGLLLRYRTEEGNDGLTGPEGVFLPCSFWLAAAYQKLGRQDDARALFEKLTGLCNDVGLLAEEYDPRLRRQLGNFPQAFSHLALVNAAYPIAAGWRSESKQVYEPSFVETVGTASA